jgi:hypothetical protein
MTLKDRVFDPHYYPENRSHEDPETIQRCSFVNGSLVVRTRYDFRFWDYREGEVAGLLDPERVERSDPFPGSDLPVVGIIRRMGEDAPPPPDEIAVGTQVVRFGSRGPHADAFTEDDARSSAILVFDVWVGDGWLVTVSLPEATGRPRCGDAAFSLRDDIRFTRHLGHRSEDQVKTTGWEALWGLFLWNAEPVTLAMDAATLPISLPVYLATR